MLIPGLPGASEPSFRTRGRALLSLDTLVEEVRERLEADGLAISARVVKAAIQSARWVICMHEDLDVEELALQVSEELRRHHVLFVPDMVEEVLVTYVRLVIELDIEEVYEVRR
ncbi:MAG: hypothetical protein H6741_03900 [Alphaproteobacteria bacterium]|nr:hypothetical protein [Alphaproteobacteria bacterium]MCB9791849.1 hypothetical protein [Alphaproteobacteria bacterium]